MYGSTITQDLPVGGFKWVKDMSQFNEDFMKNYNEDKGHVFEVDAEYIETETWHGFCNELPFLTERMKMFIFKWKGEKFLANLHDKQKYFIQIRNLKPTQYRLVLKIVH